MFKKIFTSLLIILTGCIEPYEFIIHDDQHSLVVEGYISNISFNETLNYPSSGRYFTIKLSYTSDVTNERGEAISTASVSLINDEGTAWRYTPDPQKPGEYHLSDRDFKAEQGYKYQLRIELEQGERYESTWGELPAVTAPPMGDIHFEETQRPTYVVKAGERDLVNMQGITAVIDIPTQDSSESFYYRWDFRPMWVYIAPLASPGQPDKKCWVNGINYLTGFTLQTDNTGGYEKDLFFMETVRNERIFENFSVLIIQHSMSEDYYNYWNELQEQNEDGTLFDKPPYNLRTNIYAVNGDKRVSGYFGIVAEQAKRVYFNTRDLSYIVPNTLTSDCLVVYGPGPPAPPCTSCLAYSGGLPTNIRPEWWKDN